MCLSGDRKTQIPRGAKLFKHKSKKIKIIIRMGFRLSQRLKLCVERGEGLELALKYIETKNSKIPFSSYFEAKSTYNANHKENKYSVLE